MNARKAPSRKGWLSLLWLAVLPALACTLPGMSDPAATETAVAATVLAQVAPTLEAAAATDTPAPPTETPPPTEDLAATSAAATEEGLGPIRNALASYGVPPEAGRLAWVHNPVVVEVTEFKDAQYASDYPTVIVRDFVVQADVVWTTGTGLAGCGFIFRADAQSETFYGMGMFRGGNGVSVFNEWRDGTSARWERYRDVPSANVENGGTNRLAVVARGSSFTFYVNGAQADSLTNPDLTEGAVGFGAFSESGTTNCEFRDGWLWALDS